MSILIDALSYVAGAGSIITYQVMRSIRRPKYKEPHSIKWAWEPRESYLYPESGFRCQVCWNRSKNTKQPTICECDEFPREHFHFECKDCKYKAIMRVANDIADQPVPWYKKVM